ncbi:NUDIX hydrolase [Thiofilum flexile]|uniref:NUDIX hydrolase n=1 Tax=Thiofilum flexile TaxID=125627 RepID=UPI00037796AE|nr:NUDIX hydrolase [Thiofilum flexile]
MVWKPRVTVASVVMQNNKFLMVEEVNQGRVVINQPAGHLEHGESLLEAVCRETLEETGWKVKPTALLSIMHWQRDDPERVYMRFSFLAEALEAVENAVIDPDIRAVHWLTWDEIISEQRFKWRSPLVMETLNAYQSGVRYPLECLRYYQGGTE